MATLRLVRQLIEQLNSEKILYCHWKSNEHLQASMDGLTDLDILVDREQDDRLQKVLAGLQIKRFEAVPLRKYKAIDDYLGCDPESGTLVHLHLHYQLVVGERFLKGYRLPWEKYVLGRSQIDSESKVRIMDPNLEAMLLLIRVALKLAPKDRHGGTGKYKLSGDMQRELNWLKERVQAEGLNAHSHLIPGWGDGSKIIQGIQEGPSYELLMELRTRLSIYRTLPPSTANRQQMFREGYGWITAVIRKLFHKKTAYNRTSPRGGTIIAFLGVDGSGKSAVSRKIQEWLVGKLEVELVYFGSGDGPASLTRRILQAISRVGGTVRGKNSASQGIRPENRQAKSGSISRNPFKRAWQIAWAISLAREKRMKLQRMWQARGHGSIVLCDRYPQSELAGLMDGPQLRGYLDQPDRLSRWCAEREASVFQLAKQYAPDLVIKLLVTPEVSVQRKKDMGLGEITRRSEFVKILKLDLRTEVTEINADKSLEQVILHVKNTIWSRL